MSLKQLDTQIDSHTLYQKITEILVYSQYEHWVEKQPRDPTAAWIADKEKRARDFYMGRHDNPMQLSSFEQNKFHAIVNLQAGVIMREIEKYL